MEAAQPQAGTEQGECEVTRFGHDSIPEPIRLPVRVKQVSAGAADIATVSDCGCLYAWGKNESGQCGAGHTSPVASPQRVLENTVVQAAMGDFHMVVRLTSGLTLECGKYRADNDIDCVPTLEPTRVIGGHVAKHVAAGGAMALVLLADDRIYTWATNSTPACFFNVPGEVLWASSYSDIGPGGAYSYEFALVSSGELYVAGRDFQCRLGLGSNHEHRQHGDSWVAQGSPAQVPPLPSTGLRGIAQHKREVVAFCADGSAFMWGLSQTAAALPLGRVAEEPIRLDFGSQSVASVSLSSTHGVAVTEASELWTWGQDDKGQRCGVNSLGPAPTLTENCVHHAVALDGATVCFYNIGPVRTLTLWPSKESPDAEGYVTCAVISLSGEELANLKLNLEQDTIGKVRSQLISLLGLKIQALVVLLPDGRVLDRAMDHELLSQVFL